jgi:hypothetical protein
LRIDVTRLVTIVGVVAVVIEPIAIFLIGKLL